MSQLLSYGYRFVVGVDEVGRGPLAGPVVACAAAVCGPFSVQGVKDSKELTSRRREELEERLCEALYRWAFGEATPEEIDSMGISSASKLAMARAVWSLGLPLRDVILLVDGPWRIPLDAPQLPVKKGDKRVPIIAAASILAKLERDRIMVMMDGIYPGYGFSSHKGYPTRSHVEAIRRLGPSPIHRRSFKHCD